MRLLFATAAILFSACCFGQQQTYYFVRNNGALALTKDSADYIRVVTDPEKGSDLFTIAEFYISGSKKSLFKSLKAYPVLIEGTRVSYFPNGRRKATENYKDGILVGNAYEFYPKRKVIHS